MRMLQKLDQILKVQVDYLEEINIRVYSCFFTYMNYPAKG